MHSSHSSPPPTLNHEVQRLASSMAHLENGVTKKPCETNVSKVVIEEYTIRPRSKRRLRTDSSKRYSTDWSTASPEVATESQRRRRPLTLYAPDIPSEDRIGSLTFDNQIKVLKGNDVLVIRVSRDSFRVSLFCR